MKKTNNNPSQTRRSYEAPRVEVIIRESQGALLGAVSGSGDYYIPYGGASGSDDEYGD